MRYALIFAGVVAAYDAYSHDGYSDNKANSSTPAFKCSSSVPAYGRQGDDYKTSFSSEVGYTTIYPCYGKQP